MAGLRPIPCTECSKGFRTPSGLKWHLFHIHKWTDTRTLLKAPSQWRLAAVAYQNELELGAFTKGIGVDVDYLKRLVEDHLGKEPQV